MRKTVITVTEYCDGEEPCSSTTTITNLDAKSQNILSDLLIDAVGPVLKKMNALDAGDIYTGAEARSIPGQR